VIFQPSQTAVRLLLCLPVVALLGASIALVAASPSASGAAREFGYSDFLPVIGGVIFALPTLMFALVATAMTWRRTRAKFRLAGRRMALGLVPIAASIALLISYTAIVDNPDTYRGPGILVADPPSYTSVHWRWEPMLAEDGFIWITVFLAVGMPMGVLNLTTWLLYVRAIGPAGTAEPKAPDPVGEILRTGGAFWKR
jgi:hypothetical protein